jgi:hypothetical protein
MVLTIIFFIATAVVEPGAEQPQIQKLTHYLPATGDVGEWKVAGTAQTYVGENLYAYINGGAVIYYEYGFKQVMVQRYAHSDGRTITLEIYEMKSPASAYGIYTFKTRGDSQAIAVGSEALRGDYYANFWKARFVVTLIASDSKEETIEQMLALAQVVDARIKQEAARPLLVDLLPREMSEPSSVVYVKGNTALGNINNLFFEDIISVREGVVGDYGEYKTFVFKYSSTSTSHELFENAKNYMNANQRFTDFSESDSNFYVKDSDGQHIYVRTHEKYILIFVGENKTISENILNEVEIRIKSL